MYLIICAVYRNPSGTIGFQDTACIGVKAAFIFQPDQYIGIPDLENDVNIKF